MQKHRVLVQTRQGNIVAGATVNVYDHGTTDAASIYGSNDVGDPLANPGTTDSDGIFEFYAANGRYDVLVTRSELEDSENNDILLFDIADGGGGFVTLTQLASNDPGEGAALVGVEGGGTVQGVIDTLGTMATQDTGDYYTAAAVDAGFDPIGSAAAVGTDLADHENDTANPHSVTAAQVGLDLVLNVKHNLAASTAPGVNDDNTQGYSTNSLWIDRTGGAIYSCTSAATGAAVWVIVGADKRILTGQSAQSGNITLALTDIGRMVTNGTTASARTCTVPNSSTVSFPTNIVIPLTRTGSGTFTLVAAGGVTINRATNLTLALRAQHSGACLWYNGSNVWTLFGDTGT